MGKRRSSTLQENSSIMNEEPSGRRSGRERKQVVKNQDQQLQYEKDQSKLEERRKRLGLSSHENSRVNSDVEESSDSDNEDEENNSDYENANTQKRKKKSKGSKQTKRRRTSGGSDVAVASKSSKKGKASKKKKRKKVHSFLANDKDLETDSKQMFESVLFQDGNKEKKQKIEKGKKKSVVNDMTQQVNEWMNNYDIHDVEAMRTLVHFILLACGCDVQISAQSFVDTEPKVLVNDILEYIVEENIGEETYPIVKAKSANKKGGIALLKYKKFPIRICDFLEKLVKKAYAKEELFNDIMLHSVIEWLTAFSASSYRAFRHTAVLLSCKLITMLISLHEEVSKKLDSADQQLSKEAKKKSNKKQSQGHKKELQRLVTKLKGEINDAETAIDQIFQNIYVNRFRDSVTEIREICVLELGVWELKMSSKFCSDNYTMYHGWTLHDKEAVIRRKTVQSLAKLYQDPDLFNLMENFTHRYKERLIEMLMDVDDIVCSEAAGILRPLLDHQFLDTDDLTVIYDFFFGSNQKMSQIICDFVYKECFGGKVLKMVEEEKEASGKKAMKKDIMYLRAAAQLYITHQCELADKLVINLWGNLEELKDWKLMLDMLLENIDCTGIYFSKMNDKELQALLDILSCSVKHSCGLLSLAQEQQKQKGKGKVKPIVEDVDLMFRKTSEIILPKLPDLLSKFATDPRNLSSIVDMVQCLDLSYPHETKPFEKMFEYMEKACNQSVNRQVVSKTLEALKLCAGDKIESNVTPVFNKDDDKDETENGDDKGNGKEKVAMNVDAEVEETNKGSQRLSKFVSITFRNITDNLETRFKTFNDSLTELDDDEKSNLSILMMRLDEVSSRFDIGSELDLSSASAVVTEYILVNPANFPTDIVLSAIRLYFFMLSWEFKKIDPENVNDVDAKTLSEKVRVFSKQLVSFFESEEPVLQLKAFFIWTDLLVMFSKQLKATSLYSLALVCSDDDMNLYCNVLDTIIDDTREDNPVTLSMAQLLSEDYKKHVGIDLKWLEDTDLRVCVGSSCLIAFFNLIFKNIIPAGHCHGYLHLLANDHYDKVIRYFLSQIRKTTAPEVYADLLVQNLNILFEDFVEGDNDDEDDLEDIKDTAVRFVRCLGIDIYKEEVRKRMLKINELGIKKAVSGEIKFLQVIEAMSFRLIPQDAVLVIKYLDELIKDETDTAKIAVTDQFKANLQKIADRAPKKIKQDIETEKAEKAKAKQTEKGEKEESDEDEEKEEEEKDDYDQIDDGEEEKEEQEKSEMERLERISKRSRESSPESRSKRQKEDDE